MEHIEHLIFTRRCDTTKIEKVAAVGTWAKLTASDVSPLISFANVCVYAREGACPPDVAPATLLRAIAHYIRYHQPTPSGTDTISVGDGTYTICLDTMILLDGLVYALMWPDRLDTALRAMLVVDHVITPEQHIQATQSIVPWLVDMAPNLSSARMEILLKELYCACVCPIAASARHRNDTRSFYSIFRDHNLLAPNGSFEIAVPTCSQKTPKSIIAALIPSLATTTEMPPITMLHVCAAFSIFLVFLQTVCTNAHALVALHDDDADTGAAADEERPTVSFKFTTPNHIEENVAAWCDPFTVYYTDTVAIIRGAVATRISMTQPGCVPSPFFLIQQVLDCITHTCAPNTKIERALATIHAHADRRDAVAPPPPYA